MKLVFSGHIEPSSETIYPFGTTVTYSCTEENNVLFGDEERMCEQDRQWTGQIPHCKCIWPDLCM